MELFVARDLRPEVSELFRQLAFAGEQLHDFGRPRGAAFERARLPFQSRDLAPQTLRLARRISSLIRQMLEARRRLFRLAEARLDVQALAFKRGEPRLCVTPLLRFPRALFGLGVERAQF